MTDLTLDRLREIAKGELGAMHLGPCEEGAMREAFEGGGGIETVDSAAAAEALDRLIEDLHSISRALYDVAEQEKLTPA